MEPLVSRFRISFNYLYKEVLSLKLYLLFFFQADASFISFLAYLNLFLFHIIFSPQNGIMVLSQFTPGRCSSVLVIEA